ncbi:MAG: hypothetical protein QXW69_07830 [Nitrososphaerota archaeon]
MFVSQFIKNYKLRNLILDCLSYEKENRFYNCISPHIIFYYSGTDFTGTTTAYINNYVPVEELDRIFRKVSKITLYLDFDKMEESTDPNIKRLGSTLLILVDSAWYNNKLQKLNCDKDPTQHDCPDLLTDNNLSSDYIYYDVVEVIPGTYPPIPKKYYFYFVFEGKLTKRLAPIFVNDPTEPNHIANLNYFLNKLAYVHLSKDVDLDRILTFYKHDSLEQRKNLPTGFLFFKSFSPIGEFIFKQFNNDFAQIYGKTPSSSDPPYTLATKEYVDKFCFGTTSNYFQNKPESDYTRLTGSITPPILLKGSSFKFKKFNNEFAPIYSLTPMFLSGRIAHPDFTNTYLTISFPGGKKTAIDKETVDTICRPLILPLEFRSVVDYFKVQLFWTPAPEYVPGFNVPKDNFYKFSNYQIYQYVDQIIFSTTSRLVNYSSVLDTNQVTLYFPKITRTSGTATLQVIYNSGHYSIPFYNQANIRLITPGNEIWEYVNVIPSFRSMECTYSDVVFALRFNFKINNNSPYYSSYLDFVNNNPQYSLSATTTIEQGYFGLPTATVGTYRLTKNNFTQQFSIMTYFSFFRNINRQMYYTITFEDIAGMTGAGYYVYVNRYTIPEVPPPPGEKWYCAIEILLCSLQGCIYQ